MLDSNDRRPSLSPLNTFLDKVVCDGRYLRKLQQEPKKVAQRLGLQISLEVSERVSSADPGELFGDLCRKRSEVSTETSSLSLYPRSAAVVSPIIVAIVAVIAGLIFIIFVFWRFPIKGDKNDLIIDHSPNRDLKL